MNHESGDKKPSPKGQEMLQALCNGGEHGIGYKPFTEVQKKDLEGLLARGGYALEYNFPIYAETVLDIIDYVNETPHSEKRKELGGRILEAFAEAQERMGDED